jgi:hypothetical protein
MKKTKMDENGRNIAKNNLYKCRFEVLSIWNHNIKIEMQCQPYLDHDASDGMRFEGGGGRKRNVYQAIRCWR